MYKILNSTSRLNVIEVQESSFSLKSRALAVENCDARVIDNTENCCSCKQKNVLYNVMLSATS